VVCAGVDSWRVRGRGNGVEVNELELGCYANEEGKAASGITKKASEISNCDDWSMDFCTAATFLNDAVLNGPSSKAQFNGAYEVDDLFLTADQIGIECGYFQTLLRYGVARSMKMKSPNIPTVPNIAGQTFGLRSVL
jgi:hypothetical protein